jgi:hypothetical protein
MEAAPGFEPRIKELQSSALPLGYAALRLYNIVYSHIMKILPYFLKKRELPWGSMEVLKGGD